MSSGVGRVWKNASLRRVFGAKNEENSGAAKALESA